VSRNAVFEEDRAWNWSNVKQGSLGGDGEPFTIEYVTIHDPRTQPRDAPTMASGSPGQETPVDGEQPSADMVDPSTPP
jgi:hypothetical protein